MQASCQMLTMQLCEHRTEAAVSIEDVLQIVFDL